MLTLILKMPLGVYIGYKNRILKEFILNKQKVLNLGSGNSFISSYKNMINLDQSFTGKLHVIGKGEKLPFKDGVFNGVVCDQMLEHVAQPEAIVCEIKRVLRGDGEVFAASPFNFYYHPEGKSYSDYHRFTLAGLENLFAGFTKTRSGVAIGPTSTVAHFISCYLALVLSFGNKVLFKVIFFFFRSIFIWTEFLDEIFIHFRFAHIMSSGCYFLGSKNKGVSNNVTDSLYPYPFEK